MPFVPGGGSLHHCLRIRSPWLTSDVSAGRPTDTLDRLRIGDRASVAGVGEDHRATLAREGIEIGSNIVVEASAPFGGPLVVGLDRARIALARSVARTIHVERSHDREAGSPEPNERP